ncbi:hypothetical protein DSO57_1002040 [Entomophthora muscae]|uniref:Uncharacterized protein n=1 Tax=Entomophthora muscae TaxID=34485 RepID=A0ACC2SAP0_9FUNG|nr:hypothetical protein DSO57_1002040 [Entomophthora muscae]
MRNYLFSAKVGPSSIIGWVQRHDIRHELGSAASGYLMLPYNEHPGGTTCTGFCYGFPYPCHRKVEQLSGQSPSVLNLTLSTETSLANSSPSNPHKL